MAAAVNLCIDGGKMATINLAIFPGCNFFRHSFGLKVKAFNIYYELAIIFVLTSRLLTQFLTHFTVAEEESYL